MSAPPAFQGLSHALLRSAQVGSSFGAPRAHRPRHKHVVLCKTQATRTAQPDRNRRPQNVEGDLYVNTKCIDCDTCRQMAPATYIAADGAAAVHAQPTTDHDKLLAYQAMVSCPVGAIRTASRQTETSVDIRGAAKSLPYHVSMDLPGVFYNGFADKQSFACASYTLLLGMRGDSGGLIVDSPRFSEPLAKQLERVAGGPGGVKYLFLTHRDDVGDHAKWAARLGCRRIIHEADISRSTGTDKCEMILRGDGPWDLPDDPAVQVIAVPGHSRGSIALFDRSKKALFTGDHLAYSKQINSLTGFPRYNSYDWNVQVDSIQKLVHEDFLWLLPGHGRRVRFHSDEDRVQQLSSVVERMRHARI